MYYSAGIFYVVVGSTLLSSAKPTNTSLISWISTYTFSNGWHPTTINSFVPGGWSIAAEMMFYGCFPILIKIKARPIVSLMAVACSFIMSVAIYKIIISKVPGDQEQVASFAYFFWLTQLPAFVLGIAICSWLPLLNRRRLLAKRSFPILIVALATAALSRGWASSYVIADVLFFLIVLSAAVANFSFLKSRALAYIGQISFSMYLVHFFIIRIVMAALPGANYIFGSDLAVIVGWIFVFLSAIIVSGFTYNFIEKPGKDLGTSLWRHLNRRFHVKTALET